MFHTAFINWNLRDGEDFVAGRYSRSHTLSFDGGTVIVASASPQFVGHWADPDAVDPEEMLVAAVSSCHMLWFLHMARLDGLTVAALPRQSRSDDERHRPRPTGLDELRAASARLLARPRAQSNAA